MTSTTERRPNRLIDETSPYLQQHAYNPVEWYPWGEEALQKAREEDKPIFLSIGYSACHWCHVMEHESFEDPDIAELMNRHFVNIKVDREERPDLDQIYMNAVTALAGRGGWPLSAFLTPDLKPFWGGTYWPPTSRMGLPGSRDILERVHEVWQTRRDDVLGDAERLTQVVTAAGTRQGEASELNESLLAGAMRALLRSHDGRYGGFGQAPKFPHPMDLRVLLRCWKRFAKSRESRVESREPEEGRGSSGGPTDAGDTAGAGSAPDSRHPAAVEALKAVNVTLDHMARGGIYDHLGGGFHRYSTDPRWLVPHFEKMLYDNALLSMAYLEAARSQAQPGNESGEAEYTRVVRETLDYVLREMTQPAGGFYSTQDADSEGEEGRFFVWSEAEIDEHLSGEDARVFKYCYDVTPEGNWEGRCILNRVKTHAQAARMLDVSEDDLANVLARCRKKLFEVREQRVKPGRDEKVLVGWNGLMISAMSQAASVLANGAVNVPDAESIRDAGKYAAAARRAADFVLENMRDESGRLLHSFKDGKARFTAYLDDYACLIDGLVELYQAVFDAKYLEAALKLSDEMIERFADPHDGGFFYTAADHEKLIARNKDTQDGATPSGNASAATGLLKLARLCGRSDLEEQAAGTLEMLSGQMSQVPLASSQALIALDFYLGPSREIVVCDGVSRPSKADQDGLGRPSYGADASASGAVLHALHQRFVPNKVVARRGGGMSDADLPVPLSTLLAGKTSHEGEVTVFICERGVCHQPAVGLDAAREAVSRL